MPRINSTTWSVNDQITAVRLHDFNEDLDDLYSKGSDRLRVVAAVSGTALRIDIGAGTFNVGGVIGNYAGATDVSVTNTATNYVEIDSSGTIQINTTGWTTSPAPLARLAIVVCSGGVITSITQWKTDAIGGQLNATDSMFGDASDGAKTISSSEDLDPTGEFEYSSFTLNSSQTMSVSSTNSVLTVKVQGNVTINGTIDLNSKGGDAGAAGVAVGGLGGTGGAGNSLISGWTSFGGAGGSASGYGGAGGSNAFAQGANGYQSGTSGNGSTAGALMSANQLALLQSLMRGAVCGGGGGGGSGGTGSGAGALGGVGGGAMCMYIGGNLTLGASSIIRANGGNGANGTATNGGGGGGGAGGVIIILVGGSITNSGVTLSASGGTGGTGHSGGGPGGNGGAGAAGKVIIYSLADGTLIVS